MPLVLRLKPGQDFFVGAERYTVNRLLTGAEFEILSTSTGRAYLITEEEATELKEVPEAFVSSGGHAHSGIAKIAIDAPRAIVILRGQTIRREQEATVKRVAYGDRWS